MKKRLQFILTLSLVLLVQIGFAQTKTVTGTVTDGDLPLGGVSVQIKGTQTGTSTDFDGNYSISASVGDVLVFSYVGTTTQEITVGASNTINVTLAADTTLDEVVVVAYGTSTKEQLTGAVTQITTERIEKRGLSNPLVAIDGAAAGVRLTSANGQPGSTPAIRIRGFGSVNASQAPLIILDGSQFSGSFSSINPNDIASFSILKDAASTALYGNRAANGVVIITTKKGKQGKNTFTLNVSQGFTDRSIEEYRRVTAEEYYPLIWESIRNQQITSGSDLVTANQFATDNVFDALGVNPFNVPNNQIVGTDGLLNPNAQLLFTDLDYQDPLIRTGNKQNADFTYSGANENTDYFASLSYFKEEGFIVSSDFERFNTRINVNTKLNDWFKTGINLSAASSRSNNGNAGATNSLVNPFATTRTIAPIFPVFLHDPVTGDFVLDDDGNRQFDFGDTRAGITNGRNVILENLLNTDRDVISTLGARTYAEFTFLKDFKATFNASLDRRNFFNITFGNPVVGDASPDGRASRFSQIIDTQNYTQLIEWNKSIGNHNINLLGGHESFQQDITFLQANRTGLIVDGNTELINFTTTTNADSGLSTLTREGFFTRANYNYDGKYFLSGSFRRDASSRFINDRWGNFWSVGGSWRIVKESFMDNVSWVNDLKLRASYGQLGNDNLGFFPALDTFDLGLNDGPNPGILLASAGGNPDLTWETNIQTDIAIEFGLFNNRINGTFEYYNRESEDLLFNVPQARENGVDTAPANIGSLFNRGFEFDLNFEAIKTQDFSWNVNVNGTTLKNEITELPDDNAEITVGNSQRLRVGGDLFAYFIRDFVGVDPADGAALYVADPELAVAGDPGVRVQADGTVATTDQNDALRSFIGSAVYDLAGAFTHNFRYKQFELGMTFIYQLGGETLDTNYQQLLHSGRAGTAFARDILNRWQQPGDITNQPRLDASQLANFDVLSDRFLISSDFLALRQVSLAYNLSPKINDYLGITAGRIYANGENIFQANGRRGLDATQTFNGNTTNTFTPARTITLGLNLTF
ncbi:SusC/RagA family TonB-linked outer membrane protein [Flavobacteriaceae bacterium AU392]|nr:SusC/RagA family TonB-linked outer membrane protein [Flavobacteriaceae bacterium]RKM83648.1 SusC/RagA family TonB-linked outer membrane protein [Flavobacteriaceae bacterium AU392]